MAYDEKLANRVRAYLSEVPYIVIEEKKMFGGLAFLVNDKMCINVSGDRLMCRFDPELTDSICEKPGVAPMIMKGRTYKGYCYVEPSGFSKNKDFEFWLTLCLGYNTTANDAKPKEKAGK